jgi:hypothetical protein
MNTTVPHGEQESPTVATSCWVVSGSFQNYFYLIVSLCLKSFHIPDVDQFKNQFAYEFGLKTISSLLQYHFYSM